MKELSMTPDAIRKRAKRAAEKAAEANMALLAQQMELAVSTQQDVVQIIKVGHALVLYRDKTVKKDSIWGIARIGKQLVKFYGRRGATPRFRIEKDEDLNDALELFELKKQGLDVKKLPYKELDAKAQDKLLGATFAQDLMEAFGKRVADGKVDTRAVD